MKAAILSVVLCALLVLETAAIERKCNMEHSPVCATYHVTHGNECVMESKEAEMAEKGLVLEDTKRGECECDFDCPRERDRVCGSDGNFYKNECEMKKHACETNTFLEPMVDSRC